MRRPLDTDTGRLRLLHLRDVNEARGVEMAEQAPRFHRIAGAAPTPAVVADNLFQTPEPLANRMAELLHTIKPDARSILEPSAGLGRLYRATRRRYPHAKMELVENAPDCARELYRETEGDALATLRQSDFLAYRGGRFDAVIMNPPFRRGSDVKHYEAARAMLNPGGVIVGLCFDGAAQNKHLRPECTTWEPIGQAFTSEGTRAAVVLLTLRA